MAKENATQKPPKKAKKKPRSKPFTFFSSVADVEITDTDWFPLPGPGPQMWQLTVHIRARITTPTAPAGATFICMEKKAWLQRWSGGTWNNISPESDLQPDGGNFYKVSITVPEIAAPVGGWIQAISRARWNAMFSETDDSDDYLVPAKP